MATCVRIFAVDGGGEGFDSADKELAILLRRLLQVADEPLDLVGHDVEGVAEIAELRAARDFDTLRKVARRDAVRTAGKRLNRIRQLLREEDTDQERQQSCDKTDPKHLPAHFGD